MEYAIGYMVSVFVFQALTAWRNPREDFQVAFVATVFWPFILVLVAGSFVLDWIGWDLIWPRALSCLASDALMMVGPGLLLAFSRWNFSSGKSVKIKE